MRYIWVTHDATLSGANKCLLEVVEVLKSLGQECEVVVTRKHELAEVLLNLGIIVHIIPYYGRAGKLNFARIKMFFRNILALFQLILLIRRRKANKVVSNTITVGVGAWAAYFLKIKHIWYVHEFGREDHGIVFPFGDKNANKLIGRLSEKVIVVSNALKEKYSRYIHCDKIKVLYNFPKMKGITKDEDKEDKVLCLLMVGQIAEGKRQEDALKAVKLLIDMRLNVSLTILGNIVNEKYFNQLKVFCKNNGIENNVQFKGYVSNPYQYIKNADIMLICSKSEAFGRTTVEAMLLGTLVIGANSGATNELIKHKKTGLLYECCNPLSLAETIQDIYNDTNFMVELSENCKKYAKKVFNETKFFEAVTEAFF